MVTQWLCGEQLSVCERHHGWVRARGGDEYAAWVPESALLNDASDRWTASAAWSLGVPLVGLSGRHTYLPWGSRVLKHADGSVELPGGVVDRPADPGAIVVPGELRRRFPPDPDAVVETARAWIGVPYLWGGRTDTGCDCSGFTQSVFGVHGTPLPRDSGQQAEVGEAISGQRGEPSDLELGDLLFFAPEGAGITHVSISSGDTSIIHCAATNGMVEEEDLAGAAELQKCLRRSLVRVTRPLAAGPPPD